MVTGKAILYVEKDGSSWKGYRIDAKVYTSNKNDEFARAWIGEDLEYTPPVCAKNLKEGERIWVRVRYLLQYHQDYYTGEVDVDVDFLSERVLKRRPPKKQPYIAKALR